MFNAYKSASKIHMNYISCVLQWKCKYIPSYCSYHSGTLVFCAVQFQEYCDKWNSCYNAASYLFHFCTYKLENNVIFIFLKGKLNFKFSTPHFNTKAGSYQKYWSNIFACLTRHYKYCDAIFITSWCFATLWVEFKI